MGTINVEIETYDGVKVVVPMDLNTKITPNFQLWELANTSAKDNIKYIITPRSLKFLKMAQKFRDKIGTMQLTSHYRTKSFNDSLKNADKNSAHLIACAMDFIRKNETEKQRKEKAEYWEALCCVAGVVGAINYYTNGYHIEIYSDLQYGSKKFAIRDYRGTAKDW